MNHVVAVLREAWAVARSQTVASIVTIIMVAGMVAAVLLTTGRTVGSEQAVLGSIDSAGTRSIIIRAESSAGLDSSVVERLANVDGAEAIAAFGPVDDGSNVLIPGADKVPTRVLWFAGDASIGIPTTSPVKNSGMWVSEVTAGQLGLESGVGGVATNSGAEYSVLGKFTTPAYLDFLEPLAIAPQVRNESPGTVSVLVVIAERPELVAPLTELVVSVLGVDDPTKVQVETSEDLAKLRSLIQDQLGSFGRGLTFMIFGLTAVLVAVILYGLVVLRRKDFGRRRALGASQRLIIALLLSQVTMLGTVGVFIGTLIAVTTLLASGDPLPGLPFITAV
ncbi:FtsX-like permease family protein, partial [Pseudolysinimonas sp.]|uniref:FtsX-like permease family protein n=1 Tax=Pseudolysinimonas sp. TaxID=2680009 RepID=UPI003782E905